MQIMNMLKSLRMLPALAVVVLLPLSGRAQVGVSGITDANYGAYSDSATFTVTNEAGYSYDARLDGNRVPTGVPITSRQVDYHELRVWRTNLNTFAVTNQLVRFIIRDSVRSADGSTEDGIPPWTPYPPINGTTDEFAGGLLRVITPQDFPTGYPVPVVAWVENAQGHAIRANGLVSSVGQTTFQIKRGVGSGYLAATNPAGVLSYLPQVGGLAVSKSINLQSGTSWTTVSGNLGASTAWPANSRISVTAGISVPAGGTLTIGAGTIVIVGAGVNLTNLGAITINGTTNQPVVFMPATPGSPWGGFVQHANNASITATGTIFSESGADQCWYGGHGRCATPTSGLDSHRPEQPLFALRGTECNITLTDCAALSSKGQFGHAVSGYTPQRLTLTRTLVQGGPSGGEYSSAVFTVNDCAFFDFWIVANPFWQFNDGDEDALYIADVPTGYLTSFTNTFIGWTKDDGVDSGGSGPGFLRFQNCWFEGTYHEGNSLSGTESASAHADKDSMHVGSVFFGCGQAYENGYGAVTGRLSGCLVIGGNIGFRFGDNYNWHYYGPHYCTNSILLNNYRDVWGMTWQPDTSGAYQGWLYRTNQMDVRSNWLTAPNPIHPSNQVWSPSSDGWRLASFLSTPPDAKIGLGFAVWTNQFPLTNLFQGVPVGMSSFTTNYVTVDYAFQDTNGVTLAAGTLSLEPGRTAKRIYPSGFDVSAQSFVRLVLSNPVRGQLTGLTNVAFLGSVPSPQVSCWISTNRLAGGRMSEGVLVQLSTPAGLPVTVDYAYQAPPGLQASGTLNFAPGETVKQILPTGVPAYQWVRMDLANPSGVALTGITSVNYTNPPLVVAFGTTTNELSLASFNSGLPVVLTVAAPTGGVTVDFKYEGNGAVLTNGTLLFTSGQTLVQLLAPTVTPTSFDVIRVTLSNPTVAGLGSPTTVYYLRTAVPFAPTNATFTASNSVWYYFDKTNDLGTAWRSNTFDSSSWSNGPAQLGFGDGDERTVITSNSVNTCYYFRRTFVSDSPANYTNLYLWILEDDSAVVYLNGTEIFRGTNLPAPPTLITNRSLAKVAGPDNTVETRTTNTSALLLGTNLLAVEMHQATVGSSDISFDFQLTGYAAPAPVLTPAPVITTPTSGQIFGAGWGGFVHVNATNTYTNVTLYVDSVSQGQLRLPPFDFTITSLAYGSHDLIAVASDASGNTLASTPVTVTAMPKPTIDTQPTNQVALTNATVTFSVAASGPGPLSYSWFFIRTNPVTRVLYTNSIAGMTNATLILTSLQATNAGYYQVLVGNPVGWTRSDAALLTIPNADTDGDGLTDTWELAHGLNPLDPSDASADPDHDGMTNLQEFLAGTDPHDGNSYLKVTSVAPATDGASGFTLQFNAVATKTYSVLCADVLPTNFWARVQDITAAPTDRLITVTNDGGASPHRFYRLVTPRQP